MLMTSTADGPNPTAPAAGNLIKDVDMKSFMHDVIEASQTALTVVVFWSTYSQNCKPFMVGLEKLITTYKGTVLLRRADLEKTKPIAQQLGIQSVPSVFAFFQGRPVDGFMGALPEAQVKTWLDPLVKATSQENATADSDSALKQAEAFLNEKNINEAQSIFGEVLSMDPLNARAFAGLLRCLISLSDHAEAERLLNQAPPEIVKDKALDPIRTVLALAKESQKAGSVDDLLKKLEINPGDHATRFQLANAYFASGERESAVDHLLEIVRRQRSWNEDAARKQLVKYFEAFGLTDPLTIASRKKLSALLFA